MNRKYPAALAVGSILFAPMTPAAQMVSEPFSIITCQSHTTTREIRTSRIGTGGCRVDYLKDGAARVLWSASSDPRFCAMRASALAATLTHGNFSCTQAGARTDNSGLTEAQIVAANLWLRQRVESLTKVQTVRSGPEAQRYSTKPDFLAAADLDADGNTDLVLGWSWASFRCDGTYLTVLINDASDEKPAYRPAEVQLPGDCGAKGWLSVVKDIKMRRIVIDLQQRYPGANNVQQISATLRHDGEFTFFGPGGRSGSLEAIEKALPTKSE